MEKRLSTMVLVLAIAATARAGSLSGQVTRSDNDQPVAGALVIVRGTGFIGISDASGTYSISDIPNGSYGLSCSAPGLRGVSAGATWIDDDGNRDFSLAPPADVGTIQGSVTCSGNPCQGVLVQARQGSNVRGQDISRPTTGAFAIVGLEPGQYQLRGLKAGYLPATADIDLPAPATDGGTTLAEGNLALTPGGPFAVSGIVGLSDNPVDKSGSSVRLNGSNPTLQTSTATGGSYSLAGIPAGPMSFTAWRQDYRSQTHIDVIMTGDRQLNFVLARDDGSSGPPRYTVSGTVTLAIPDGGQAPPATPTLVSLWSTSGDWNRQVEAGADGSYSIGGALAGEYRAGATREGFLAQTSDAFNLDGNRTINFTLELDPDYDWGPGQAGPQPGCGCGPAPGAGATWLALLLVLGLASHSRRT